jgi:gamma-glutamylcyclotransferase
MASLKIVGDAMGKSGADFTWFIYASSLDREAFAQWAAQHGYNVPDFSRAIPARLSGYRLAFDIESRFWGGAVASLAEDPHGAVEGLALPMPGSAQGLVEHKEGAASGLYLPLPVSVVPLSGGAAIDALAYRGNPARALAQEAKPSPRFLEALVQGAKSAKLTPSYLAGLEQLLADAR